MKLLAPRHWGTIMEAGAALAVASLATRLLPFNCTIRLGTCSVGARDAKVDGPSVSRIVDALADRLPLAAVCLQRGLALQWLLHRRGVNAVLHYGVQLCEPEPGLSAHVWVSVDGQVLMGAPQHQAFTEVACYPTPDAADLSWRTRQDSNLWPLPSEGSALSS